MKNWSAIIIGILLMGIWSLLEYQGLAIAGTVDVASLSPADSNITVGFSQGYAFSAVNNKSFTLKEYSAVFKYDTGLSLTDLTTAPVATIASVNTSKKQIQLKWTNVAPGIELKASFTASANVGTYHISPYSISYQDNNRKRYSGTCNAAILVVASKPINAAPPKNFRSILGEGFITIAWDTYVADPIVGYVIYRRTLSTQYTRLTSSPINLTYKDTNVQNNVTYYYAITAADASGNESTLLAWTAETYFDLKKMIINKSRAAVTSVGDINGDGKPDIVIGLPYAGTGKGKNAVYGGAVEIYYGGNTTGTPDVTLWGENSGDKFGFSLAVTDLNNDGYDDLIIGAPGYDPTTYWPISGMAPDGGRVYVYAGGQTFSTSPVETINGDWSYGCNGGCYYLLVAESFGYSIASVGDTNGDGFNDVAIGAPHGGMDRSGSVFILYGNNTFSSGRSELRGPDSWQYMGTSIASAGDVNSDGHKDILTCGYDPDSSSPKGKMYLYYDQTWVPALSAQNLCRNVAMPDINGDGYADIAVSTNTGIDIYYGGPQISAQPSFTFPQNPYFPSYIASFGKLNNDGYDDLIGGGPIVYFGSANGENLADIQRMGLNVIGVGDIDGDGRKEAFVTDSNVVYVYSFAPYLLLPVIEIQSPKSGSIQSSDTVMIEGQVRGTVSALKVGGSPAALLPDGTFSATSTLADGDNIVEITAETPDGKISKRMLYLSHLNVPPLMISITSPANGAVINTSPVTVTGTVSDPTTRVTVNGIQAVISGNTFSASGVPLQEGPNTLTVYAVDGYNQTATDTINVTLVTKSSIAGTVTDAVTSALLPDVTVAVTDSGGSHTAMTDSEGKYLIEGVSQGIFTAIFSKSGYVTYAYNGNVAAGQTITINIQLTSIPPLTISITSPLDGAIVNSSQVTVTGSVSNNASVIVNGISASVSDDTFNVSIPVNEGQNTLTAIANDRYGQTESQSITVTLIAKGSINGIVTDSSTGLPVTSATVSVTDSFNIIQTTLTGSDGKYTLNGIASGTFTGTITKEGFTLYNFSGTISPGQTVTINASLTPATNFTVTTIGDYGNLTVMAVSGNYDAKNPDGSINSLPRQEIAKEFLKNHSDQYDFFVIFSNFDFSMPDTSAKAFYLEVKNDTQGIGKSIVDNSTSFGSIGKLQGTIDMGNFYNLTTNPVDPKFEETISILAHEQLHRWGASVKFKDASGNTSTALLGKDGSHWSFLLDSDGSVMYGNDWKDNGNETFTSVSASKYYSPLDLYLMGMIDKSKVPPMLLIENTSVDPTRLPAVGATISGTAHSVTIDDIIGAEGQRVPDATTSQKTFKTAFIFITRPGTYTGSELPGIENVRNAWAGRFSNLTEGKGSIADVTPSITITIGSPTDGETITSPDVMVKGAIINSTGNETGVKVNGIVANVSGNQFIANHVPLVDGANTITITATDTAGNTATTSITVTAVISGNYIRLTSNIESGIAPLEVTLRIDGSFTITESTLNITGPVMPEIISSSPEEYTVKMTIEGVYTFTATTTGPDGITYQDTVVINVMNKTQLDTLLKGKWNGMKTALANQDIVSALNYYSEGNREHYNQVFTDIYNYLPQFVQDMQEIQLIYLKGNIAKYRIKKDELYSGQMYSITYYVYFTIDQNGIWKIEVF
ncbi:MAG: FG-GAP-like repeat-containing protein [Thermodesulfovibrionales bacterium]